VNGWLCAIMILVSLGGFNAAVGQEDQTSTVFVRFHEGAIADPGPASGDTVWLPEDFAFEYQGLLARLEEAESGTWESC